MWGFFVSVFVATVLALLGQRGSSIAGSGLWSGLTADPSCFYRKYSLCVGSWDVFTEEGKGWFGFLFRFLSVLVFSL